jgi:hypothetical protein
MKLTNKSAIVVPPHDPLADWKVLPRNRRITLVNHTDEVYLGYARIRLRRGELGGSWLLQVVPVNENFYQIDGHEEGTHILVGGSIIDELKKLGVPMYIDKGKK